MAEDAAGSASCLAHSLTSFPCDLIANILLQLSARDICCLAACCSELKTVASCPSTDFNVWKQLCDDTYGSSTDVPGWLQNMGYRPCLYRWALKPLLLLQCCISARPNKQPSSGSWVVTTTILPF
jgi:hypothetical protein